MKKIKGLDIFFITVMLACVLAGITPRTGSLRFFVRTADQENGETVQSVTYEDSTGSKEGRVSVKDGITYASISLPSDEEESETITVTSQSEKISAFYYSGISFLEYYNKKTLTAYSSVSQTYLGQDNLQEELTLSQAIDQYNNEENLLIFAVKGDMCKGLSEEDEEALKSLGITYLPSENNAFLTVVQGNEVILNNTGEEKIQWLRHVDDHLLYLVSSGVYATDEAKIYIDGVQASDDANGLNLVVYNTKEGKVVDSLSWNMNTSDVKMTRYEAALDSVYTIVFDASFTRYVHRLDSIFRTVRCVLYLLGALLALILWCSIRSLQKGNHIFGFSLRNAFAGILVLLAGSLSYGYQYLSENFKEVSVEQLVFHANTDLTGTNWSDFNSLFEEIKNLGVLILLAWVILELLFIVCRKKTYAKKAGMIFFSIRWVSVISAIVAGAITIDSFWWSYDVYDYLVNIGFEAEVYDEYVDPLTTSITFPEKKKNLIYIFMESMEISASSEANGGGKSFNAIPELTDLALNNTCFNGDETTLNGAVALTDCTWTIAGITAQSSGLPLGMDNSFANKRGTIETFMPGATMLGDILSDAGYTNCFMLGSDAKFGNRNTFFSEHGDYEIDDYYWARNNGLIDNDYFVWWGYEDQKLFSFAKDKASELASGEEPFNLTLLTVDTHFTNGYLCEQCPDTYEEQYSNVLACSSKQVSEFVAWVQEQSWGKDTVIVLSGDHLCMDSNYYGDMPDGYERKTYVCILNSDLEEPEEKRSYATIDMFPTTLAALGCDLSSDRLGLGTNLYGSTLTLLEEKGEEWLNQQFSMNSDFYKENILYGNTDTEADE